MAYYHKLEHHKDKTPKHKITEEEREFLRGLQKELNTQDNLGQADPRFWVIEGTKRTFSYGDNCCIVDDDGDILLDSMEEVYDYIIDNLGDINDNANVKFKVELVDDEFLITDETGTEYTEYRDLEGICDFLNDHLCDGYRIEYYALEPIIYENRMFLTQKDAENHLRLNHYHYSDDAHTYAMTAWRSPEVEKLIKILREVEW